ncbi:MAG TPA: SAM-dependent methyltransferase, partial [Mycobacterium sp.]|nr:SAM-dependent methyltransferase [Mycobacterium sp.]
ATALGAQWAAFCRAAVFPAMSGALDAEVSEARSAEFFDRLEAGVAARVAAAPEQMQIPMAHLVLVKRAKAH